MKNNKLRFGFIVASFLTLIFVSYAMPSINKLVLFNRAAENQLNILISLQGDYDKIPGATFKTKVDLYSQSKLVKRYSDVNLTKDHQNIFKLTISTAGLNLTQMYAIFIKPDKYLGRLFCSPISYSSSCKTPQIAINSGINNLDLTQGLFFSGDISPQDGKIAADDISKIFKQIGQSSTGYLATDINSDGIVQTVDYSLVLYSLSKNYTDDPIPSSWSSVISTIQIGGSTPIPTTSVSSPTITPTTITTPKPTNNPTPTVVNSSAPSPTAIANPTPTTVNPSPTVAPLIPTPTTPPIPTPTVSGGTCKAVVSGKIYGNYSIISFCSPLSNEPAYMCVTSSSDCTAANCIEQVIKEAKAGISMCTSGAGSLNESSTRPTLGCQVQFIPGPCVPTPTPTISCSQSGPSC